MSYIKHFRTVGVVGAAAIATPFIAEWEGYSGKVYYDIVGVPTQCFGETKRIDKKRTKTREECLVLLEEEVAKYVEGVQTLVKVPMSPQTTAAFTSMSYNVGLPAFSKSTALKKLNAGDYRGACNEMTRWAYAGKMWVKGLHNRRLKERELCLSGL